MKIQRPLMTTAQALPFRHLLLLVFSLVAFEASAAVHYVNLSNPSPAAPYTSWATAATNIQDAINAAGKGDQILVTNGIYASGASADSSGASNRIAVTKVVTVQSVNGPAQTVIDGGGVFRCLYLTNDSVLAGFTLTNGSGYYGAGAYGFGTLSNCVITGNSGPGAYYCTVMNCVFTANSGDGIQFCSAYNCAIIGNAGNGASGGGLFNCTVAGNSGYGATAPSGYSSLYNCIVYYNAGGNFGTYNAVSLNYCCTTPMPLNGSGTITNEPGFSDSVHLGAGSPCRGAGSAAYIAGADIDGEAWENPPSIGCDEFHGGPVVGPLQVSASADYTNTAAGLVVNFSGLILGHASQTVWDFADGTLVTNRAYSVGHTFNSAGNYPVTFRAYNDTFPAGLTATVMVHVLVNPTHYVSQTSANPVAPFTSWATAATNIQDAVDAAYRGGQVVVSKGVYQTGWRVSADGVTNRLVVTNGLPVRSVNGSTATIIDGGGDFRCALLLGMASLTGFTLTNGSGVQGGWDMYATPEGAFTNCVIAANSTGVFVSILDSCIISNSVQVYGSKLYNCRLTDNGAEECTMVNCLQTRNSGCYDCVLNGCVVTGNSSGYEVLANCRATNCSVVHNTGYGVRDCTLYNCIVFDNAAGNVQAGYYSTLYYCCTTPMPQYGDHNITADPQLTDKFHIAAGSPCRAAGSSNYTYGVDIDGEAWLTPPSIGCDEFHSGPVTGSLAVSVSASYPEVAVGFVVRFAGEIDGHAMGNSWDFGDGTVVSNQLYQASASHSWSAPGDFVVTFRAYNDGFPGGVSASVPIHVVAQPLHYVSLKSINPVAPYASWDTAATNINDAIDAASVVGALVLVTNGVYQSGGRYDAETGQSNRVAVSKPVTVESLNGPATTIIKGSGTRCAYLTNDATLSGFTLTNGISGAYGGILTNCILARNNPGGGASHSQLENCTLTSNTNEYCGAFGCSGSGGGAFYCTLNNCTLVSNACPSGNSSGGGAYVCSLTNCVLVNNLAWYGGGAEGCTLENCTVTRNSGGNGGGVGGSVLHNCLLAGNAALGGYYPRTGIGGGADNSTLQNCTVSNNTAVYGGGGVAYSLLYNCTLAGNSAPYGGGAAACSPYYSYSYPGGLFNCVLVGNSSSSSGGGANDCLLNNCTVTANTATYGGGIYDEGADSFYNCVIYYNSAPNGANYYVPDGSALNFCCTTPLPDRGLGNITAEPLLSDAAHLTSSSLCRAGGSATNTTGVDIDGEPWANPPSIGCDEFSAGAATGPLTVTVLGASFTNVATGFTVGFAGEILGHATASAWDFGDGTVLSNRPYAQHYWTNAGDYTVELRAYNDSNPAGVSATLTIHVLAQPAHYVSLSSVSPVAPYTSWATAATNIQDAIDAATLPGALVLISNGVYQTGSRYIYGVTNRLSVTNQIALKSVNGPSQTVIDGGGRMRCLYLTGGSIASGMTLTNGVSAANVGGINPDGGGVLGGTLVNCVLAGNTAGYAGGASSAVLYNCLLTGNHATNSGGGAYNCTLINCSLTGNSAANSGGGAAGDDFGYHFTTLANSVLSGNTAPYGGGIYRSSANDCTITGNSGFGAAYSTLKNCIVYYNLPANFQTNYDDGNFSFCCTTPLPTNGIANITAPPQLTDSSHIGAGSPCRAAGSAVYTGGLDIDGDAWASPPSIGCDEFFSGTITGDLLINISADYTNVPTGFTVNFTVALGGHATASRWEFGDGIILSNAFFQPFISHTFSAAGDYAVSFRAYNDDQPSGMVGVIYIHVLDHPVQYVSLASTSPVAPFTSWATAATNIQDALDQAFIYGTIMVSNGVYLAGGRTDAITGISNRIAALTPVTLQSVNGATVTRIDGASLMRCAYLTNGATLKGFTLTNGNAGIGGGAYGGVLTNCTLINNQGGGAYSNSLFNCTLSGNQAGTLPGGGAAFCILNNCTVTRNVSNNDGGVGGAYNCSLTNCAITYNSCINNNGGGVSSCTLSNCTLANNSAGTYAYNGGGGAFSSTLTHCTLTANSSTFGGGGAAYCGLDNCTLTGNSAIYATYGGGGGANSCTLNNCALILNRITGGGNYGGGASQCVLNNCILINNSAASPDGTGGGAYNSTLNNCTLTGNSAGTAGGGVYGSSVANCIVYYNNAPSGPNYSSSGLDHCCTTPMPPDGFGNISSAPAFVSLGAHNLRLLSNSPCINSGNNAYAPAGPDLDANPRIVAGTVDLGAYEFQTSGRGLFTYWLAQYGQPTDGSADYADPDGDGFNNWQEYLAGTLPNSAASALRLQTPTVGSNGVTLTWPSVADHLYFIERSTNLSLSPAFLPLAGNIPGQAGSTSYTDTNAVGRGPYFYRLGTQPPPSLFQIPLSTISFAWLQRYGLPTDGSADFLDSDGDGMNNYQEWRAGTSPLDASSSLKIISAAKAPNGITVTWKSVNGVTYFLERSTNLAQAHSFNGLVTGLTASTNSISYTDTTAAGKGPFFYRVGVQY